MSRKKAILGLSIVVVALLVIYPWKRVVVAPAIRIRVLDEAGNPVHLATVKQEWEYRVIGSKGHQQIIIVDENGYASFPERTERVSLIRLIPAFAREMIHLPHGYKGFGSIVTVWAYGPDRHDWTYVPFNWYETLPQEMRLTRHPESKDPHAQEFSWRR
jgi:hypothetical protein